MTDRISNRPPVALTLHALSQEPEQVAAPAQFQGYLEKISKQKMKTTIFEDIKQAVLAVLQLIHGPLFNTLETRKNMKNELARDVLARLNNDPITYPDGSTVRLGELFERRLVDENYEITFNDSFTTALNEFAPGIAEHVADEFYRQCEPELLNFVNSRLDKPINPTSDADKVRRAFIRRGVDEVAKIAFSQKEPNVNLDHVLGGLAKALHVVDELVRNAGLEPADRDAILKNAMAQTLPSNVEIGGEDYHKVPALNRAITEQLRIARNRIDPAAYGRVVHPTWKKY
jgi:hypothetical protein